MCVTGRSQALLSSISRIQISVRARERVSDTRTGDTGRRESHRRSSQWRRPTASSAASAKQMKRRACLTTAGFLPAAGSKTCRSSYSTATASYASRLSVAVRRPLAPAPNQAPGTRILTLRSACCWPAWCLKNMLTSADERRAVGGIAARRARTDAEPRGARRAPGSQCQGRPSVVVGRTPEGQVSLHVIALRSPLLLGVLWPAALRCPGALQCQPAAGTGVPSAGPSGRPGVLASSAGCTVCNLDFNTRY